MGRNFYHTNVVAHHPVEDKKTTAKMNVIICKVNAVTEQSSYLTKTASYYYWNELAKSY